ncbi:hypothetical protein [Microbacterium sp. NPDC079176]|uniref:hypothetical protein n=1 Tax=Microbacterium sp. NPDC079176 TaxID=3154768 RepID=UPI0034413915
MAKYLTIDHDDLQPDVALDKPVGYEFIIEFRGEVKDVEVSVLRTGEHEWQARRQFGLQATIYQLEDESFDPRQHGYPSQPTLHDAIRVRFSPF